MSDGDITENTDKSLENLKPWKPGESGNPNGRPKGIKNRSTIVREILELVHEATGQTYEYASTKAIADKAATGDVTAWERLMDSAYGKVTDKQEVDLSSKDKSMSPSASRLSDITDKIRDKPQE